MTDDITPERQRRIEELLGQAITDPDPEREHIACPDCRTPTLAMGGGLFVVVHDHTCPAFAAMPAAERTQITEDGAVTHVARASRQDT